MNKPRPSPAQLRAWRADEVTDWVMRQLYHHFPDYHQRLPIKDEKEILLLNGDVMARRVLETVEKLVENGSFC